MASTESKSRAGSTTNKYQRHPFVYGIIVLIIVVMSVSLIAVYVDRDGQGCTQSAGISLGSWNGVPVRLDKKVMELAQAYEPVQQYQMTMMYQQYGMDINQLSEEQQSAIGQSITKESYRSAFMQMTFREAFLERARSSGALVSDYRINQTILGKWIAPQPKTFPWFELYLALGDPTTSLAAYNDMDTLAKASAWDSMQTKAIVDDYMDAFLSQAPTQGEKDFLLAMDSSRRSFRMASVPFSSYPDSEVVAYAKANPADFRTMQLSYIRSDKSKSVVKDVYKSLSSGTQTWEQAEAESLDKYTIVKGVRGYAEIESMLMTSEEAAAVFSLAAGSWSGILETKDGQWVIFLCDSPAVDADITSADTLATVRSYINDNERGVIETWAMKAAGDFAAKAAVDFDAACKEFGYEPKDVPAFPINFGSNELLGTIDSQTLPELSSASSNAEFFQTLFSLKAGEVSKPLVIGDSVMVFRFVSESAPEQPAASVANGEYLNSYLSEAAYKSVTESPKFVDNFETAYSAAFRTGESAQ